MMDIKPITNIETGTAPKVDDTPVRVINVALCLSGQPRMIEAGYEYHKKNILEHHQRSKNPSEPTITNVKVFFHTWRTEGNLHQKAVELYKPVDYMVQNPIDIDLSKYTNTPPPSPNWKVKDGRMSTYAQLYAINKCNKMKSEYEEAFNMKFDWVVRSRFDFAINELIPFELLNPEKLFIPNCRMTPSRDFGNDQFAFSSSENMDKYADCFNNIDEFYDSGVQYMCEDFMSANWKKHGLVGENLVYCDINHPFPPGEYNGTWHSLLREDFKKWLT